MPELKKNIGRVVLLTLVICFSWIVLQSGRKLNEKKIGRSVTEHFSQYRLFPSMSFCMRLENVTQNMGDLMEDMDVNLQRVLDDALISFVHYNKSESG